MGARRTCMRWLLLLALACAPGLQAETPALAPVDLFLVAKITIAPDGRISELAWLERDEGRLGVARTIEPTVLALEFVPGHVDGVPAVTETTLRTVLRATPVAGGNWELAIRWAATGARAERMGPPRYPADALVRGVEAEVSSDIEIDVDGRARVVAASVESSAAGQGLRRAFLGASEKAIAGWRFVPERVGGHPVAGRMRVPVSFCLDDGAWCQARNLARLAEAGPGADEPVPLDSVARLKSELPGAGS